jgi:hypothetical protein
MGMNEQLTLEEIGSVLGVTRERVRQIYGKVQRSICVRIGTPRDTCVSAVLDVLEDGFTGFTFEIDVLPTIDAVLDVSASMLENSGWAKPNDLNTRRIFTVARVLTETNRWPNFRLLARLMPPPNKRDPQVIKLLAQRSRQQAKRRRRSTYAQLAEEVLEAAGKPLHWKEIVRRAENLGIRKHTHATSLYNTLIAMPEVFARVDQGTYGLCQWGLVTVDTYVDIIAAVLSQAGIPLAFGEILHQVNASRPIKSSSLTMHLTMHPRCYRSVQGRYGLRVWLPPRDRQTLRTPPAFVEEIRSYERLSRAKSRGYDVDNIVAKDAKSVRLNAT